MSPNVTSTADFLLELRCEEIPARMQAGARADLEKLFRKELDAAGLKPGAITVWSTPRRLALIAKGLPLATEAVREEAKGPRTSAPEQALEGFLRKTGLTKDQLTERDGVWFAVTEKPGRATADVLAEAIPAIVRAFPWPKSQRWGAASLATDSLRWVRPLSGIVAILGEDLVELEVGGIRSGYATLGHRFHHAGEITIGSAHDYAEKLRACHVIVDHVEREGIVRTKAKAAAEAAGLVLVEDEGLVIENAGLTEWPQPLLGRFDEAFLAVPPEVIQLTARINQKYFICRDGAGNLANAFVCTANIEAKDHGVAIVDGNRKVLAARLSDARFFWEQDKKKPLALQAEKLARITFHEKLGTVGQRQDRFIGLADAFQGQLADSVPAAKQAAAILKADLVTEMVGEFPELQGLMGGYYAAAEGLPGAVAAAVRDHYKPAGQSDALPTEGAAILTALIDKIDALVGFFGADLKPTGSKDPFALRRAALGVIRLVTENELRLSLGQLFDAAAQLYRAQGIAVENASAELLAFFADRLKVQQREAGVRHDLIDAVFAVKDAKGGGEDDLVRLLARVHALQAFVTTEDGTNLLAGYKRAANILKKEGAHDQTAGAHGEGTVPPTGEEDPLVLVDDPALKGVAAQFSHPERTLSYQPEPAEQALIDALDTAEPRAEAAIAVEDFTAAMAALASLRAPIDSFFDQVTVNDADANKRASRLGMLGRFRAAVHKVADFSRIEG
ncbi:glycine--tRNA ligase subunit beta [Novosphingobium sp. KCTC 2891]|uniref:glycine--tRNA ligase subunit beta n=1 Tax=Novosphingobium sp. KCTC 2891 TaxID=2989730 RepID=UPI0022232DC2|nr:glycine--tRNA ligase subunit beta [Novosphingobium sp. KCTC 2891]MCW1381840.1 glycine--tRNA ligase subunit beta [Novosphingobium sp. KCTC 2891]